MPTPLINPNTSVLVDALSLRICDLFEQDGDLYNRPENAAVLPEALLSVLASVIASQYQRSGHAELIRLSAEKLTDLVEEAYAVRLLFGAAADAGAAVSTPPRSSSLAKELAAVAEADALADNPPPDMAAELERLMARFFSDGPAKQ